MHDRNGTPLKRGDIVVIEARIKDTYVTQDGGYCNLTVETIEPMFPTEHCTQITFNARQVILSKSAAVEEVTPEELSA